MLFLLYLRRLSIKLYGEIIKTLIFSQSFVKTAQKHAIYCSLFIFLYLCDKFVVEFQIWTNKF